MEAVFDRFIRVPKMIYGSRRLLFRHFIEQHGAEIEETELSALTIIADKYSVNDIKTVCRRVLTSHRVKRNKVKIDEKTNMHKHKKIIYLSMQKRRRGRKQNIIKKSGIECR